MGPITRADIIVDAPRVTHDTYLELADELGIPGLLAFLAIAIGSISCALRAARLWERAGDPAFGLLARGLALGVIAQLTADIFITNEYEHLLWVLLALPPARARGRQIRHQSPRPLMPGRPLRVLFVINQVAAYGGAERFAAGLATHMPRDRIEPWLCCTRRGDERAVRALVDADVRYVSLGRQREARRPPAAAAGEACFGGSASTSCTPTCSARTSGRASPDGPAAYR